MINIKRKGLSDYLGGCGVSLKEYFHYSQLAAQEDNRFYFFNYYDNFLNLKKYGTFNPPEYDLELIRMPIHLVVGQSDMLAPPAVIPTFQSKLVNAKITSQIVAKWGHSAFSLAINANEIF
jgi:pimeloyl-ACP methyl ester carboxylesterase